MGQESVENLRVKISGQSNMAAVVVGMSYRLPDQEEVCQAFFRQLGEASSSQALTLMGKFNHILTWKNNTARRKQSRRFLKSIDGFLTQVIKKITMKGALRHVILTNGSVDIEVIST